ncbi:MAG TPA: DUF4332 domain-containing protein [Pseudogracilibacillus sp.]|nr:DUF4332 domain-containing protein [Pseudogracilibacillus sp.]
METNLKSIKGIGVENEKKLFKANIKDVETFIKRTETPEKRTVLAKETEISLTSIYNWAKQAELMSVKGISPDDANLLVRSGIRSIDDLVAVNAIDLLSFIRTLTSKTVTVRRGPSLTDIQKWQKNAESITSKFKINPDDEENNYIFPNNLKKAEFKAYKQAPTQKEDVKESGFFSDFSEIITEIGAGIAGAQHQLDLSSIEIQNTILEDEELAGYGLNATWYTMPDINFNLKMEYMVVEEKSKVHPEKTTKRINIIPSNAKYNNFFQSTRKEQSSLDIKFMPVPPPERLTERNYMPDLIGLSEIEAKEELELNNIKLKEIITVAGTTTNDKNSEVTYQSINPGKIILINEQVILEVTQNN